MAIAGIGRSRKLRGFTLIEVMITVAIVGILASIALPMYFETVTRSKIIDGTTKLGNFKDLMDRYYPTNNATYVNPRGSAICGIPDPVVNLTADYFAIRCIGASDTGYTITATGIPSRGMGGFFYTVTQTGAKTSTGPAGWSPGAGCWALRKDGSC